MATAGSFHSIIIVIIMVMVVLVVLGLMMLFMFLILFMFVTVAVVIEVITPFMIDACMSADRAARRQHYGHQQAQ